MFSVVCVCSRASGSYVTITHDPLDFTEQGASRIIAPLSPPSNMGPEDVPVPPSPCQWHLVDSTGDLLAPQPFELPPCPHLGNP